MSWLGGVKELIDVIFGIPIPGMPGWVGSVLATIIGWNNAKDREEYYKQPKAKTPQEVAREMRNRAADIRARAYNPHVTSSVGEMDDFEGDIETAEALEELAQEALDRDRYIDEGKEFNPETGKWELPKVIPVPEDQDDETTEPTTEQTEPAPGDIRTNPETGAEEQYDPEKGWLPTGTEVIDQDGGKSPKEPVDSTGTDGPTDTVVKTNTEPKPYDFGPEGPPDLDQTISTTVSDTSENVQQAPETKVSVTPRNGFASDLTPNQGGNPMSAITDIFKEIDWADILTGTIKGGISSTVSNVINNQFTPSGEERGADLKALLDTAYPGTTPWEQLSGGTGGGALSSGAQQRGIGLDFLKNERTIQNQSNINEASIESSNYEAEVNAIADAAGKGKNTLDSVQDAIKNWRNDRMVSNVGWYPGTTDAQLRQADSARDQANTARFTAETGRMSHELDWDRFSNVERPESFLRQRYMPLGDNMWQGVNRAGADTIDWIRELIRNAGSGNEESSIRGQ